MRHICFASTLLLVLVSASTNEDQSESTEWKPEPIAIGIALKENVMVYADSSRTAAILDTLNLAEDILTFVPRPYYAHSMNRMNWLQVETWRQQRGWVRRNELIILTQLLIKTNPDDSVFAMPTLQSDFLGVYRPDDGEEVIDERVNNDGRTWLSLRSLGTTWGPARKWLLVKNSKFDLQNAYFRILMKVVGFSLGFFFSDDISVIHEHNDYAVILEIINRVEKMLAQGEPVPPSLYNGDNEVSVSTAVLPSYARSNVYRLQGDFAKRRMELGKMMTQYADQQLFSGRAGPEAAMELAEQFLAMGDTANAIAQFHSVIVKYPGEAQTGFEWNDFTDLKAAERIISMLEARPKQLGEELDRITTEAQFPPVRLQAYVAKVQRLGSQGLLAAVMDTALAAIQLDPDVVRTFGQSTVDFASNVAAAAIEVFEQRGDSTRIAQLAQTLQNRFPSNLVDAIATLKWARFIENRNGDPALVRRLYQHIIDDFSEFQIYDPITQTEYGIFMARQYLGIEPE